MPAPAPAITYKSTPVPYNEVYFNDLQLKNLYTANTTPLSGTGWITNSGTGGTGTLTYSATGGPGTEGYAASAAYARLSLSGAPTSGNVGAYRNQTSGPALTVPGATYTHTLWVRASIDCPIVPRVESYNGTSTLVESYIAPTVNLVANTWTRISVTRVAPAGTDRQRIVAYCPVVGYWDNILATLNFDYSSVMCEQTSDTHDYYFGISNYSRSNLVSNPSFEVDASWWSGFNSTLTRTTSQAWTGLAAAQIAGVAGNNVGLYNINNRVPVSVGYDYTLSAYVKAGTLTSLPWRATVLFYDASTAGNIVLSVNGASTTVTTTGWTRVSVTGNVPSGATHAQLYIQSVGALPSAGQTAFIDGALFEQKAGLSAYYAGTTGTNATPDTITVYRLCDGETNIVRGAKNYTASSAFTINDFEAPFGKAIQYWAVTSSSGTSLGTGEIATTTLNVNEIWVHDPLDLTNAIQIFLDGDNDATLGQGSFGQIVRSYDYNRTSVLGKSRPVLQFYGEKAIENLQFQILAKAAANEELMNLLSVGPVLVRVPGALGNIPRLLYCVLEASQEPIDWHLAGQAAPLTRWSVTANEVEPQSLDIVITFYSYAYWQSRYSSYTAASAAYGASTYIDAVRNPPL